jgi:hypothetical protein
MQTTWQQDTCAFKQPQELHADAAATAQLYLAACNNTPASHAAVLPCLPLLSTFG